MSLIQSFTLGKLYQQFAVDAYVKIEQNSPDYHRQNQQRLRADSYRGLQDYLAGTNTDSGRQIDELSWLLLIWVAHA